MTERVGLVAIGFVLGLTAGVSVIIGMALEYEQTDRMFRALRAKYGAGLERKPSL